MSTMMFLPLQAAEGGGAITSMVMMGLIFVVMYFFMIRPQQKRQKELVKFRESLKSGDKVITAGGIYAKVKEIKDNIAIIEIANNINITIDKSLLLRDTNDMGK